MDYKIKLRSTFVLLVIHTVINSTTCNEVANQHEEDYVETTVKMITIETTTEFVLVITDIPQSDVDAALNLDVGEYTTQVFDYHNFGFTVAKDEICYKHYLGCILDEGLSIPICSVNDPIEIPHGYITHESICDVHLDNCRRLRHFWRLLDFGRCIFPTSKYFDIQKITKRRFGETRVDRPWTYIFHILGRKDDNSEYYN